MGASCLIILRLFLHHSVTHSLLSSPPQIIFIFYLKHLKSMSSLLLLQFIHCTLFISLVNFHVCHSLLYFHSRYCILKICRIKLDGGVGARRRGGGSTEGWGLDGRVGAQRRGGGSTEGLGLDMYEWNHFSPTISSSFSINSSLIWFLIWFLAALILPTPLTYIDFFTIDVWCDWGRQCCWPPDILNHIRLHHSPTKRNPRNPGFYSRKISSSTPSAYIILQITVLATWN